MTVLASDFSANEADGKDGDITAMPIRRTPGLTSKPARLKEVVHLLELSFGLSSRELAQVLGVNLGTLVQWASSDMIAPHVPGETDERFHALLALNVRLSDLFESPEDARAWLHRPLPFLGQMLPIDAIKAGRIESVDAALEAIDDGFAS